MQGVSITSDIGPLKRVMLHRPGKELLNLIPRRLEDLLFDDIPFLKAAQEEHDAFSETLRSQGVEVVYLEDLMTEVLEIHPGLTEPFLYQWLREAGIRTHRWQDALYAHLRENYQGKDLVEKTMEGITLREMGRKSDLSLQDLIASPDDLIVDPMPNLYFTRDPAAVVGDGLMISRMCFPTRRRETIYTDYIFRHHPDFIDRVKRYYDRNEYARLEGGDVICLTPDTVAIGISQRTSPDAIEKAAANLFSSEESGVKTILAFFIPSTRAFMHLDTVFTQVDRGKYTIHPGILGPLKVFEIRKGEGFDPTDPEPELSIRELTMPLEDILKKYTGAENVRLIPCGGSDPIAAAREQWNDGSNTLCVSPGVIIVYSRNELSNNLLREEGLTVLEIPSSELSRGRGGPRCMSMPLNRELYLFN